MQSNLSLIFFKEGCYNNCRNKKSNYIYIIRLRLEILLSTRKFEQVLFPHSIYIILREILHSIRKIKIPLRFILFFSLHLNYENPHYRRSSKDSWKYHRVSLYQGIYCRMSYAWRRGSPYAPCTLWCYHSRYEYADYEWARIHRKDAQTRIWNSSYRPYIELSYRR